MLCPSDKLQDTAFGGRRFGPWPRYKTNVSDLDYSYAMNYHLPHGYKTLYPGMLDYPDRYNPFPLSKIKDAPGACYLLEAGTSAALGYSTYTAGPGPWLRYDHAGRKKMNCLFVDGHVASLTAKEVQGGVPHTNMSLWPPGFRSFWFGQPSADGPIEVK
jgi:prepilin-type processing-associated H-X9-DG protein